MLLPWRDDVAALLVGYFGGQEMGNAVADILLGAAEPGGGEVRRLILERVG